MCAPLSAVAQSDAWDRWAIRSHTHTHTHTHTDAGNSEALNTLIVPVVRKMWFLLLVVFPVVLDYILFVSPFFFFDWTGITKRCCAFAAVKLCPSATPVSLYFRAG